MSTPFQVTETSGIPVARVAASVGWSLVEFLACQRLHVTYSFHANQLVITFHNISTDAARALLSDWSVLDHSHPTPASRTDQWQVSAG